jgi:hypothetical protein
VDRRCGPGIFWASALVPPSQHEPGHEYSSVRNGEDLFATLNLIVSDAETATG